MARLSPFPIWMKGIAVIPSVFTTMEFTMDAEPDIEVDTDDIVVTADPDIAIQADPDVQVESD